MCRLKRLLLITLSLFATALSAEILVTDDLGNSLRLEKPATRIVSLAPHLTELVYAAGAGDQLAAVVSFSDYPAEALQLPIIGSYKKINYESLIALQPDLVLVWNSGNGPEIAERVKALGLTVYINEPQQLTDIAHSVQQIGILSGTQAHAEPAAEAFLKAYQALEVNRTKPPINVFLQLWNEPAMTVNGSHIMSDVISLCGGVNIFADALPLIPRINMESVVRRNPDVIVATGMADERPEWLDKWAIWEEMSAVKFNDLRSIDPDFISRHTPRILVGAAQLCGYLDKARAKRN